MHPINSHGDGGDRDLASAASDRTQEASVDKSPIDIEWEERTLCRDESCIGIIGPDGRCKECGLVYKNGQLEENVAAVERITDEEEAATAPAEETAAQVELTDDDIDWEDRVLCSDESCIGVVGADGRCKECGRPYQIK